MVSFIFPNDFWYRRCICLIINPEAWTSTRCWKRHLVCVLNAGYGRVAFSVYIWSSAANSWRGTFTCDYGELEFNWVGRSGGNGDHSSDSFLENLMEGNLTGYDYGHESQTELKWLYFQSVYSLTLMCPENLPLSLIKYTGCFVI